MSHTITSMLSMTSLAGPLPLPSYSEAMGMPVASSTLLLTCSPASAFPRKPCSGENMVVTLTPFSSMRSSECLSPTMPVWFDSNATRLPLSCGTYWSRRAAPTTTSAGSWATAASSADFLEALAQPMASKAVNAKNRALNFMIMKFVSSAKKRCLWVKQGAAGMGRTAKWSIGGKGNTKSAQEH